MQFTLRHLEVFAAIASQENVSAGAQRVGLSQSAASTALAELERRTGRPLFDRVGKRLRLNETGRMLLPRALEMLDRAEELDALLAGRGGPGDIKLGATVTIGNYLAPKLIEQFRLEHPAARVDLAIGNTHEMAGRVLAFELDLALIEGDYSHPDLIVADWREDELAIFCAAGHPLAGERECTLDRLLEEEWAVREQGSGTRQALDKVMSGHWSRWRVGIELHQIEAIKSAVEAGRMIGCVSRLALRDAFAAGRLVEVKVARLDLRRQLYIIAHRRKYATTGLRLFRAMLEAIRLPD
jgi:DNA-binding transcriptional LysR family regulator